MKKLLIGLLAITSLSSLASTCDLDVRDTNLSDIMRDELRAKNYNLVLEDSTLKLLIENYTYVRNIGLSQVSTHYVSIIDSSNTLPDTVLGISAKASQLFIANPTDIHAARRRVAERAKKQAERKFLKSLKKADSCID